LSSLLMVLGVGLAHPTDRNCMYFMVSFIRDKV
jgi:hypothetical protein